MQTSPDDHQPDQSSVAIQCHWCGHIGMSVWEETPSGRELVSLDGFTEKLVNLRPYKVQTVCNNCHRAQPV
jgi:hypothetical protein